MSEEIKRKKAEEIAKIKEKISGSKAVILVDYSGLSVDEDTKMRAEFRQVGFDYKVLKNTYVRHAFNELNIKDFDEALNGPTAIAFAKEDDASCCKALYNSSKKFDKKFNIKCGLIDGSFTDVKSIEELAKLPSKSELIAKFMATVNAPIQYVVYALDAYKKKLEANG